MRTVRAVLFDLDDTLLKTMEVKWRQHVHIAREHYEIELTEDLIRTHWGKPFTQLLREFYGDASTPELIDLYQETNPRFLKGVFPSAVNVVTTLLDAGIEVGVITSAPTDSAVADLTRHAFPVEKLFVVQGEDAHPVHKPDPEVFGPALDLLKGRARVEDIAYVGDSLIDLNAAKRAGMRFFGVASGVYEAAELAQAGADGVGVDVGDLLGWLALTN